MKILVTGGAGQRAFIPTNELDDSARLVASSDKIKPEHDNLGETISSAWDWHKSHPRGYQEK